jgi:hypothetical protein
MSLMQSTKSFVAGSADDFVPEKNGEDWSDAQINMLARLVRDEGLPNFTVALRMGRSESSIITAVSRYGVRDPKAKLRTCMPCRRPFFSLHNGNRICGQCKTRNNNNWECS